MSKSASIEDTAKAKPKCEHHWVSIHQPDLPIYWITQCSICEDFDAKEMTQQLNDYLRGLLPAKVEVDTEPNARDIVRGNYVTEDERVKRIWSSAYNKVIEDIGRKLK